MGRKRLPPKVPIQIRIGSSLLADIDEAVLNSEHGSRNLWLVEAAHRLLDRNGSPLPHHITVGELLHDKITITVRVTKQLLKSIDRRCKAAGMDRTLWLMDAVTSYLAESATE